MNKSIERHSPWNKLLAVWHAKRAEHTLRRVAKMPLTLRIGRK